MTSIVSDDVDDPFARTDVGAFGGISLFSNPRVLDIL